MGQAQLKSQVGEFWRSETLKGGQTLMEATSQIAQTTLSKVHGRWRFSSRCDAGCPEPRKKCRRFPGMIFLDVKKKTNGRPGIEKPYRSESVEARN